MFHPFHELGWTIFFSWLTHGFCLWVAWGHAIYSVLGCMRTCNIFILGVCWAVNITIFFISHDPCIKTIWFLRKWLVKFVVSHFSVTSYTYSWTSNVKIVMPSSRLLKLNIHYLRKNSLVPSISWVGWNNFLCLVNT